MRPGRLAWSLFGVSAALNVAGIVLLARVPEAALRPKDDSLLLDVAFALAVLVFALVGAFVSSRMPANPIGWLFCGAGVVLAVESAAYGYAAYAILAAPSLPGGVWAAWLASWVYAPALFGIAPLLFLLFPDGRPQSRRWGFVIPLVVIGLAAQIAGIALQPGALTESPVPEVENPVGMRAVGFVAGVEIAGWTMGLLGVVLATWSLVRRCRRARGDERQQLKWFGWSAGLLAGFLLCGALFAAFVETGENGELAFSIALPVILSALPVSAGMAVLRYRLYDIDVVINRTLVYGTLTACLALTYLSSVLAFRLVLDPLTGDSDLAVAASTLAVAALFRPARGQVQSLVDRRFYRARYDSARTLEAFSARLRDELDLEVLGTDLRRVAHDTLQPAHVSLWVRS